MRWLNSTAFGGHGFFLMKRILLFAVILCVLVAFTPGFADDLTDPGGPDWEHPWDDLDHQTSDGSSTDDPPEAVDVLVLQLSGSGLWIVVHFQAAGQSDGFMMEKPSRASEKRSRGHVFMLMR
jgi:hypothetical protein